MLNKILADQQRVRSNIHQHVGFIPRMQRGFNIKKPHNLFYIPRQENKGQKSHYHFNRSRNSIWQNLTHFYNNNPQDTRNRMEIP